MASIKLAVDVSVVNNINSSLYSINHVRGEPLDGLHAKEARANGFRRCLANLSSQTSTTKLTFDMPMRFSMGNHMTNQSMTDRHFLQNKVTDYWTEVHRAAHEVFPNIVHMRKQARLMSESLDVHIKGVMIETYTPTNTSQFHMLHILTEVDVDYVPTQRSLIRATIELVHRHMFGFFMDNDRHVGFGRYNHHDPNWHTAMNIKFSQDFAREHPEFCYGKLKKRTPLGNLSINVRVMALANDGILYRNSKRSDNNDWILHVQTFANISGEDNEFMQNQFLKAWKRCLRSASNYRIEFVDVMNPRAYIGADGNVRLIDGA